MAASQQWPKHLFSSSTTGDQAEEEKQAMKQVEEMKILVAKWATKKLERFSRHEIESRAAPVRQGGK
jgi:hypothetical protein